MIISAVVVTFNRVDCLQKNLNCLQEQTFPINRIYVIDNASTDSTRAYMETIASEKIVYVRLDENMGGSGGFHAGIKLAYEDGADWIWGMDDDAYPQKEALEKLIDHIVDDKTCLWSNCDGDVNFSHDVKIIESWMFVGFFLPRTIIYSIGLPRKDFFIYLDDFEYAYRIQKKGYKILKVRDSIIIHNATTQIKYPPKRIGPFLLQWFMLPNWKYYYWVRNYILTFSWRDHNKYITLFLKMPKIFLYTLIFNKEQLPFFFWAYKDGVLGKSGKRNITRE